MKKFIGGIVVGYLTFSFTWFWLDGGMDRAQDLLNRIKRGESFPDLGSIMQYIMDGKGPYARQPSVAEKRLEPTSDENSSRLRVQAARIQHMHAEGYSEFEIAEHMGVPEDAVHIVLVFMGEMSG